MQRTARIERDEQLSNTNSFRLRNKSTSPSAKNAAKSLIGEAWTKCCFTTPTISSAQIFSILAR
jgi:hypothetical protein